jgi:hypothetical protein
VVQELPIEDSDITDLKKLRDEIKKGNKGISALMMT